MAENLPVTVSPAAAPLPPYPPYSPFPPFPPYPPYPPVVIQCCHAACGCGGQHGAGAVAQPSQAVPAQTVPATGMTPAGPNVSAGGQFQFNPFDPFGSLLGLLGRK